MHVKNLCEAIKTGLSIKIIIYAIFIYADQRFMYCNIWRDKKFMRYKFMRPALNSHNKTRTEKCRFTVSVCVRSV